MTINQRLLPPIWKGKIKTIEEYFEIQGVEKYTIKNDVVTIDQDAKLKGIYLKLPFKIDLVKGNLDVSFNRIATLEDFPQVFGDLDISGNVLDTIDFPLKVSGSINLSNNKRLTSLEGIPEEIKGNLNASFCNINSLVMTKDVSITGDVSLASNGISSLNLPNKLIVGGTLNVFDNQIRDHKTNVKAEFIELSGNPCNSAEWESDCMW